MWSDEAVKIEIRKAGFVNKGAELMLYAAMEQVAAHYERVDFVMEPRKNMAPYIQRARAGLYQKLKRESRRSLPGELALKISKRLRQSYGIVLDNELDAVLDVAGFAYGDQFGPGRTVELAKDSLRWKRQGTKLILLPQAFGPFTSKEIRAAIRTVVENTELIFARDEVSYKYLTDAAGEHKHIKVAPDFTNLVHGTVHEQLNMTGRVGIIPNGKMLSKTTNEISAEYVPFLTACAEYLKSMEASPFLLVHEGAGDRELAEQISSAAGGIEIIQINDARQIKGLIGSCKAIISSRFHGLVNALSQGVPALATGWSHKYKMLFDDYHFPQGLIERIGEQSHWKETIDAVIADESNHTIRSHLINRSEQLQRQTAQMWTDVFRVLYLK